MVVRMNLVLISLLGFGCGTKSGEESPPPAIGGDTSRGLSALGGGQGASGVVATIIGDSSDGLDNPRDLAFNPGADGELWVVNGPDDSTTVFSNAGTSNQSSQHIIDPYAMHFMDTVSYTHLTLPTKA